VRGCERWVGCLAYVCTVVVETRRGEGGGGVEELETAPKQAAPAHILDPHVGARLELDGVVASVCEVRPHHGVAAGCGVGVWRGGCGGQHRQNRGWAGLRSPQRCASAAPAPAVASTPPPPPPTHPPPPHTHSKHTQRRACGRRTLGHAEPVHSRQARCGPRLTQRRL
jgi:hypothetical protein